MFMHRWQGIEQMEPVDILYAEFEGIHSFKPQKSFGPQ